MMQGLLLCCLVAWASCVTVRYDLGLDPKKVYNYHYTGTVDFGLAKINRTESGVRLTCNLKICGVSGNTFNLEVSEVHFHEFNGIPDNDEYVKAEKLTERLTAQLAKPISFDYVGGHVSNIQASKEVTDTSVNIVRGFLELFHATIKSNQRIYSLDEVGIHGKCKSNYVTELDKSKEEMNVTQVVDLNDCSKKAELYSGMALAPLDEVSKQKGESVASTMKYHYSIKPDINGGVIKYAKSRETTHFSPFNIKGGTFRMKAVKEMVLRSETKSLQASTARQMESRGSIMHKFVNADATLPIIMQDLNDPVSKVIDLIKRLAEVNQNRINRTTTEDSIKVYQLLRVTEKEGLEKLWKEFKNNDEQRNLFLDLVVEVNDARIISFLKSRYNSQDLSMSEAVQLHMMAFIHLQPKLVEEAKEFLTLPFCMSNEYLRQTVMLSYGSLVYRHCAYNTSCSISTVQPLIKIAEKSLEGNDERKMVTALKAIGNAGHRGSIKTIIKFLPNVAASIRDRPIPIPVVSAAVQSLRLIAAKEPDRVQDITWQLFTQKNLITEVRMHAFLILFETRPSMGVVFRVTSHLLVEENMNVASIAYSYLQQLARSTTPENHYLSSACNVAMKILTPKYGRLSYSKAMRLDWFDEKFLIGTAVEAFMRLSPDKFLSEVVMKSKFFFIGRILELLELGVQTEGIKELLMNTDFDLEAISNKLKHWEEQHDDKPFSTIYSRLSGQELFFHNIKKDSIRGMIQDIASLAVEKKYTKTFLAAEARYFRATSLGFPLEISKYYLSTSGIKVNATVEVSPPLKKTDNLKQLLTSNVSLNSSGSLGLVKDIWLFFGINTELFQCGSELEGKLALSLPWSFHTKINMKEEKLEINFPLFKEEVEVVCIRSNVYAINRNNDTPEKKTPLIPQCPEPRDMVQRLNANYLHWQRKDCANSKIYGFGLCAISEILRKYYHEEHPLYYLLGYTHMDIKAVPVTPVKPIDSIHLEFSTSARKVHPSTRQLLEALRSFSKEANEPSSSSEPEYSSSVYDTLTDTTSSAWFDLKALTMNNGQMVEGYEGRLDYKSNDIVFNSRFNVSKVGENAGLRLCIYSTLRDRSKAQASIHWGDGCKPYSMSVRAEAKQPSTLETYLNWGTIPDGIAKLGKRIGSYIPGLALLYGFSEQPESNTKEEVSVLVEVTSADSIGLTVKLPEYTASHRAIPFPLPPTIYSRNMTLDEL